MNVWVLHLPEDRLPARAAKGEAGRLRLPLENAPDVTAANSLREVKALLKRLRPEAPPEALAREAERLWRYAHGLAAEDILALPAPSRGAVMLAEVTRRTEYEEGGYAVQLRWFARRLPLARLKRRSPAFAPGGPLLEQIADARLRARIRDALPLPGNRFRRFKWLAAAVVAVMLIERVIRLWKLESAGF